MRVSTADGEVDAAGASWSAPTPGPTTCSATSALRVPLEVTLEQVTYFAAETPTSSRPAATRCGSGWTTRASTASPATARRRSRRPRTAAGPSSTPTTAPVDPDPAMEALLAEHLRAMLPGVGAPVRSVRCQYTLTPDRDFVLAPVPGHEHVVVGLGAAHGFKFAPTFGRLLADLRARRRDHGRPVAVPPGPAGADRARLRRALAGVTDDRQRQSSVADVDTQLVGEPRRPPSGAAARRRHGAVDQAATESPSISAEMRATVAAGSAQRKRPRRRRPRRPRAAMSCHRRSIRRSTCGCAGSRCASAQASIQSRQPARVAGRAVEPEHPAQPVDRVGAAARRLLEPVEVALDGVRERLREQRVLGAEVVEDQRRADAAAPRRRRRPGSRRGRALSTGPRVVGEDLLAAHLDRRVAPLRASPRARSPTVAMARSMERESPDDRRQRPRARRTGREPVHDAARPRPTPPPEVLAWERRHLFAGSWTCLGRVDDLLPVATARLTQRAVVGRRHLARCSSRDGDRAADVRQHLPAPRPRAARPRRDLARRSIMCPYHAWTYDLAGSLKGAPGFRDDEGFDVDGARAGRAAGRRCGTAGCSAHALHPLGRPGGAAVRASTSASWRGCSRRTTSERWWSPTGTPTRSPRTGR